MSKQKNYPENIQKLKTQLESGNNLIDYFLVCGISPSLCFTDQNLFNLSDDKNTNLFNLSKILKPKIITKFPEFDNNNDTIDEEIISYCFPNGFKPYFNDTKEKMREKQFSIILDNNLFSSEYPQKYLTCLLFYEKLTQYKSLADDIQKVKNNLDISGNITHDESVLFNNNIFRATFVKDNDTINNKLSDKDLNHIKAGSTTFNAININNLDSTFLGNKTMSISNINCQKAYKLKYYYIPKCICVVSIHPYIKLFKDILLLIYKYSLSSQQIPIEKIITNLIIEVPIAPRGLYYIDFFLLNKKMTLKRAENNKLLLSEIDLKKFQTKIKFNIQIEVFKHLLFGSKIIFFSKNINELCETILAFLNLIFPFKYPFQVTSYLNKKNYNILESISPFFIGINEAYSKEFFIKNDISTEGIDLLIVDLDNNIKELISDETFPDFPSKIINNLEKEIKNIGKKISEDKNNEEDIEDFNNYYQEIYLYFFCELIKNYEEYLNMNYFKNTENDIVTSIETLFNCNQFIKSHSSSDIPFYSKFVNDSQLFADFIYKRMIPKNNQEIIDILLVNDILTKIKNKNKIFGKDQTDFSDSDKYKRNNRYIVPKPRELTEKEKQSINKSKEKLTEKGQIIRMKSSNQNNNISFKYNLFPELDFDIYCNNENANEYCPPPDYSEEIESINIDVISQSTLGQNINRSLEMKNYLYLSWLEVWAFTFWYIDKKERHYRFNQMLDVLDKVKHHEMNILNMLFDALNKCTENEMLLKLYRKLLELNINPSSFIYNIISGVIDKAQMRLLKDKKKSSEMKLSSESNFKFKDYNIKDNRKRTFLSLEDYLEVNTKLKFFSEFFCIECGEKINLLNICKSFDDVKNDILWIPCANCGEYNLPKIKVRFGTELLRDKYFKTSSADEIVVHSPYNLKINIKDAVMNNYGTRLNILDFKVHFKPLFWNFIWYCKIHELDYNILLPYLKDIEEYQKINFNNSSDEIFEIIYEDKLYKENLKRINKYSNNFYERYIKSQKKLNNSENYRVQKVNSFEIFEVIKSKIILKNIDINEDEDHEDNENEEEKNNIIEDNIKIKNEANNINKEENNKDEQIQIENEYNNADNVEKDEDENEKNKVVKNIYINEENKIKEEYGNINNEKQNIQNRDYEEKKIEENNKEEINKNDVEEKVIDNNCEEENKNVEIENKNIENNKKEKEEKIKENKEEKNIGNEKEPKLYEHTKKIDKDKIKNYIKVNYKKNEGNETKSNTEKSSINKINENEILNKLRNRKGINDFPKKEYNNKTKDNNFLLNIKKKLKKINNNDEPTKPSIKEIISKENKLNINIKNIDPNMDYED